MTFFRRLAGRLAGVAEFRPVTAARPNGVTRKNDTLELCRQYELAGAEVVLLLSHKYGLGNPDRLSEAHRDALEAEARELADNWAYNESLSGPLTARTRLQKLLQAQYEFSRRILALENSRFKNALKI